MHKRITENLDRNCFRKDVNGNNIKSDQGVLPHSLPSQHINKYVKTININKHLPMHMTPRINNYNHKENNIAKEKYCFRLMKNKHIECPFFVNEGVN